MSEQALQENKQPDVVEQQPARRDYFYRPAADVLEVAEEYRIYLDVPGTAAEQIDIQFEDGKLHITAGVAERQPADGAFLVREYGVADYRRSFQLNDRIDASGISADYSDGVLTVHLPKVAAAQPRKIGVNQG